MSKYAQSPMINLDISALDTGSDILNVRERPFQGHINLRGRPDDEQFMSAARSSLGLDLPIEANTTSINDELTVLWYGPDEWLILSKPDQQQVVVEKLRTGFGETFAAVTDISGGNTILEVSGSSARDFLVKGTTLDLHPSVFQVGDCAQTVLAHAGMTIYQYSDKPEYGVIIRRSFSDYLGTWLLDAAREFLE